MLTLPLAHQTLTLSLPYSAGALTIVIAIPTYFFLVSNLDDAHFLNAEEKAYMSDRILYDGTSGGMTEKPTAKKKALILALSDWKVRARTQGFGRAASQS